MMSAQFEYDEIGNTFYYVIVSFYALILIPITYFLYPHEKDHARRCFCDGCDDKWRRKQATKPWNNVKRYTSRIILFIGWIGFAILVYRITLIKVDHQEYNPYAILGLDVNAPDAEIRKQYRHLSKTAHPDRGGDAIQFDRIAKAYQALTDAESKENWEKYGNPDGPVATTFGIALPKWLVSKEYGVWVLAVYGLVFMIVLPVGVGIWWYNSIKYSVDQVLMDTTQLYGFFFHKTPNMELKRVLMILGSSFEFWKQYNKEIVERESDDIQLPQLIKELPNLSEKKKERPLCLPYSLKARVLLHAHLTRIPLPSQTLDKDRQYIIRKAPILIQEMIQVIQQLIFYASHGRVQRVPTLETIENVMRLLPMIVQAVWGNKSPLFQLPHFTDDVLRHCVNKRRRVTTCAELAALDEQQRRLLLQTLSDDEYADVIHVLSMMPKIKIESCLVEVQGEDDKHEITAGSLVTLKVTLSRSPLLDPNRPVTLPVVVDDEPDDDDVDDEDQNSTAQVAKRKPWEKPKKKKGGKAGKKAQPKPKPLKKVPVVTPAIANKSTDATTSVDEVPNGIVKLRDDARKSREERDSDNDSDASIVDVSEEETGGGADRRDDDDNNNDGIGANNGDDDDDDDNLVFDDELIKKDLVLATKSKVTHPVHCPYYPDEKYEWWWLYMIDKKHKRIVSGPVQCTTLIDEQMIELKFSAPPEKGTYSYTVIVRSDSYMDGDQTKEIKFEVLEARQVTTHPQWEEVDEEQKSEHSEDASEYTEHDDSDDD